MERDINHQKHREDHFDYTRRNTLSVGSVDLLSNTSWAQFFWPVCGVLVFAALLTLAILEAREHNWLVLFIAIVWLVPVAYCFNRYNEARRADSLREKIKHMDTVTKFETA